MDVTWKLIYSIWDIWSQSGDVFGGFRFGGLLFLFLTLALFLALVSSVSPGPQGCCRTIGQWHDNQLRTN